MKFIQNNKLFILLAASALLLFTYASVYSFRLFIPESGDEWSPKGNQSGIHHK